MLLFSCSVVSNSWIQRMKCWMVSLTQWTWIWANSGKQWRTGKPGVLQSLGLQRFGHDWVNEQKSQVVPGFYGLHYLLELAQTHAHWVSDAIQPSHLCHPLFFLHSIFPSIRVFSSESALHISWLSIRDILGPSKSRVTLWPQNFYPQTRLECGEGRAESMAALATHMLPVGFMLWRTRSC